MWRCKLMAASAALVLGLGGCAKQSPEPVLASSADSPTYATEFPERLGAIKKQFADQERENAETSRRLADFPGALTDPDYDLVLSIVDFADREGRSQAYVERFEEIRAVGRFFKAEGEEVERKVAGSVQYVAKKKNCDAELGGTARVALRKAMVERMEERLHDRSDAHALIEHHEATLGPANVKTLKDQADAISRASYAVHVGMVRARLELKSMLEQLEDVRETLDRSGKDLAALSTDTTLDDAQKKRVEERLEATHQAKARLDAEIVTARDMEKDAEQRVLRSRKLYVEALEKLKADLREKASAAPAEAKKNG